MAVIVRFRAVGNAPIMKQNFYKITAQNRFQTVIQFLRKELGWKPTDPLVSIQISSRLILLGLHGSMNDGLSRQFTYINMAFSPAPDDVVNNLFKVSTFTNSSHLETFTHSMNGSVSPPMDISS